MIQWIKPPFISLRLGARQWVVRRSPVAGRINFCAVIVEWLQLGAVHQAQE